MQKHTKRSSPHPFVDTVWHTRNISDGTYTATPDGNWDLLLCRDEHGKRVAFLAGQETKPQQLHYKAGSESVVISFRPSVYMQGISARQLVDGTMMLETDGANSFWLGGELFPFVDFQSAETLVDQLIDRKIIMQDQRIEKALQSDKPKRSSSDARTRQRHFRKVSGLSQKQLEVIDKTKAAVRGLQAGKSPVDAAADSGFYDQAHMAKAVRKVMNRKASDIDDIHKV